MDPIDRGAPPPWQGTAGKNGGVGPSNPAREMPRDSTDFHAWLGDAPDANRMGQEPLTHAGTTIADATPGAASATMFDDTRVVGTLYPWTLRTHAYLSQLGVREADGSAQAMAVAMDARATPQAPLPYARAAVNGVPISGLSHISPAGLPSPLAAGIAATVRSVNGVASGSGGSPADAAGTAFATFWSERLFRRSVDADGNTTWWLRDYGIDAAALEDVTRSLLSQPLHQRPHRIVINGVEVWRAPHSLPEH
nr:hypothetical protein [uncultured Pseudoxanthomonas sp.]